MACFFVEEWVNRWKLLFVIFAVTFSTMLVEVLLTRVFSVVYFGQFAFLIISLALFGYGLSGVYLALRRVPKQASQAARLARYLLCFTVSLPLAYKATLVFSIDFLRLFNPFSNFLYLVLNFLVLLLPFFFGGLVLALIFSDFSEQIGRLYFVDLTGASLGSLAIIPLIPRLGPTRILTLLFLILALAWFLMAGGRRTLRFLVSGVLAVSFVLMFRYEQKLFPIVPKLVEVKRHYNAQLSAGRIEYSRWSTIDKIDVAPWRPNRKVIWINGGTMQSFLHRFDGNLSSLKKIEWNPASLPFQVARPGSAVIIGSAGGYEVLCALSHGFKMIVAIEMDPVICDLLKKEYAAFTGNIFDLPQVTLLADEGRSALKRMKRKFDVIQMVNSHNADSLLSGALSISETYIYTVESFKDYWDHLQPGGLIYILHWNGERLFATALQALKEMGVDRPEDKFFIVQYDRGFNHFFLKKGDFTAADYEILKASVGNNGRVVYSPDGQEDNLYTRMMEDLEAATRGSSVNIAPVYDNSPYFNQPNRIGQFRFRNVQIKGMGEKIVQSALVYSNSIYLSILGLSLLFSFFLIFLPLRRKSLGAGQKSLVSYFFFIGLAFIMVEIIFIKIFQLFLGSPAISISIIIFSLLVSSGVGSLFSKRFSRLLGTRLATVFSLILAVLLTAYGFGLFGLLDRFIFLPFPLRMAASFVLISLAGLFMGAFFPEGIRRLGEADKGMIGWAWGANSFATVLGSILAVIVSINWNFTLVLVLAGIAYLAAGFCSWVAGRTKAA
jgi:predicted membrane-bound spermidine synthase